MVNAQPDLARLINVVATTKGQKTIEKVCEMIIYELNVKSDISTIGIGLCASMGAFLLSSGKKGKRYALPNCEVMIHQPLGGAQGQATEIKIAAEHILKTKDKLNKILSSNTGKDLNIIEKDTDRDNFMTSSEALKYGIIDKIIDNKKSQK